MRIPVAADHVASLELLETVIRLGGHEVVPGRSDLEARVTEQEHR